MIYMVAIEEMPTKKEVEQQNALPKLVLPPVAVEARDEKDAAIRVVMDYQEAVKGCDRERMEVVVRPF